MWLSWPRVRGLTFLLSLRRAERAVAAALARIEPSVISRWHWSASLAALARVDLDASTLPLGVMSRPRVRGLTLTSAGRGTYEVGRSERRILRDGSQPS